MIVIINIVTKFNQYFLEHKFSLILALILQTFPVKY